MAKYCKSLIKKIAKLREDPGNTMKAICKMVNISEETFITWRKKKLEFSELLKKAEEKSLENLGEMAVSSLVKRVHGFEHEEVTTEKWVDANNGKEDETTVKMHIKKVMKYYPPSDVAIIFAATNTKKNNFKHKQDVTISGDPERPVIIQTIANLDEETLRKLANAKTSTDS